MSEVFELPDLGEGLLEAEIVSWHVSVGDHVVADQPLVSVETDKALVDVPSPRSGRIGALFGEPGSIVRVGAPLVEFSDEKARDAGAIVGEIPRAKTGATKEERETAQHARAAPAVRRIAAQLGIDLDSISPTGPDGAITKADVEAAAAAAPGGTKLRAVRRAMSRNMVRARQEIVHATIMDEADIESWASGTDATVRLIRAIAAGAKSAPSLNAWFDSASELRTLHKKIDLGIAVDTDEGLFAPVLRDVGNRDANDLRAGIDRIKSDIENRSITRDALEGATITLSNFGMFGGRFAALVVVPPQVAILGAGRAAASVVAVDGNPAVHRVLPLSLSFDHRVVTGIEAMAFLNAAIADLEKEN